jgi:hypothetical protein
MGMPNLFGLKLITYLSLIATFTTLIVMIPKAVKMAIYAAPLACDQ